MIFSLRAPSLPNPLALPRRLLAASRRIWCEGELALVEVRGLDGPDGERVGLAVREALEAIEGVAWAEAQCGTGRVGISLDPAQVDVDRLVAAVEQAEAGGDSRPPTPTSPFHHEIDHPADPEPLRRAAIALVADLAGVGLGVFGRLARTASLPPEAASVVSWVDHSPPLRRAVEQAVGAPFADVALAVTNAVAQGLAQGPAALVVDAAHRTQLIAEIRARQRVWSERAPELARPDHEGTVTPLPVDRQRPVPLPAGPVEAYGRIATAGGLAGSALALAATQNTRVARQIFNAAVPKAARLGRDAFAAELGRALARRGVVPLNGAVLRRLDRVDTVIVDAALAGESLLAALADTDLRVLVQGGGFVDAVRDAQRDGGVVAVVSTREAAALAAADCGIGIVSADAATPWTADLLGGLEDAACILRACGPAREASRRSVSLALGGSGVGGFVSFLGPRRSASSRASLAINSAAGIAMAAGTWSAVSHTWRFVPVAVDPVPWHTLAPDVALRRLSSGTQGLPQAEVELRSANGSSNGRRSPLAILTPFVDELANPLTPVLAVGAGLSAVAGSAIDAGIVTSLIALNALIGGVQRLRSEREIAALLEASSSPVRVRRGGVDAAVDPAKLVLGDIVVYQQGDVVAGDARILTAEALEVDESTLTGESFPVAKRAEPDADLPVADRHSMLYDGTTISAGRAEAVIVAVGPGTEAGRSFAAADGKPPPSGVERRLARLTSRTIPVAVGAGAAVTAAGLSQGWARPDIVGSGVSLAVASVPEGLPFVAGVAQLAAARRLAERHALVRNPRAVEALGRVDVLCFDKTGTLTKGKIKLRQVGDGLEIDDVRAPRPWLARVLRDALRATPEPGNGRSRNETDAAVARSAIRAGVPADAGWSRIAELPFEPSRGFLAALGEDNGIRRLAVKGAPEAVLRRCVAWRPEGERRELDDDARQLLTDELARLADHGARVLAVAGRDAAPDSDLDEHSVRDLEFGGFLAFSEEVRGSAILAVSDLRRAGVEVVMITGDHPSTARSIAHELGILNGGRVLTGAELDALDDETLASALDGVTVYARVTPSQKVRIVRGLQRAGRTVAMTGDGANDAASMRLADCGVAVGKRSAPAAREAADIVVTTNRVETVVAAIVEGRAMWGSVRDALGILVGGNLGEIGFSVAGSLLGGAPALNARQLLLVNLLTDLAPAVVIAVRPPRDTSAEALLAAGPDVALGGQLARTIAIRAVTTGLGATGAYVVARASGTPGRARSVALIALVGAQLGQTVVAGRGSKLVLATGLLSMGALAGIVQTPVLSHFFGCRPLGPAGWGIGITAASLATAGSAIASRGLP